MRAPPHWEFTVRPNPLSLSCLISPAPTLPTDKKLEEFVVEEAEVLQILTQVNVVRRECEIVSVGQLSLGTQGAPFKMGLPPSPMTASLPSPNPRNSRQPTLMKRRKLTSGSS